MQAFYNGTVFTGNIFITDLAVLIKDDLIVDVIPASEIPSTVEQYNLNGDYLVPAFIDLQLYGGNGKLFSQELSVESLQATDAYCSSGGCTRSSTVVVGLL